MRALGGNLKGSWLGVLALVRSGASWVEKFCASFGQMCGNLWIVSSSRLGLRKITRKFNELSCFCVSVLAILAWLAWCIGWFVWCYLLDQS